MYKLSDHNFPLFLTLEKILNYQQTKRKLVIEKSNFKFPEKETVLLSETDYKETGVTGP